MCVTQRVGSRPLGQRSASLWKRLLSRRVGRLHRALWNFLSCGDCVPACI